MIAAVVLAVALSAGGAPAKAKPPAKSVSKPTEAAPANDPGAQAKELFSYAMKLYGQARYTEAIAKFEEAYALKPHAVIYFNIGKCYEQLGETGKALRAYRDYLRLAPEAPDRETVSDAIANLERRLKDKGVQQLLVFAEPPTAQIFVDGKLLGTSPSSVELTAGNHTLKVTREGYEPVERAFVMNVARATEMTINLREVKADAPVKEPVASVMPAPTVAPTSEVTATTQATKKGRVFTWVAGGAAVAAAGAGIAMGFISRGASTQLNTLDAMRTRADADALQQRASSMALGANIAFGVAGAALVAAVILFFVEG